MKDGVVRKNYEILFAKIACILGLFTFFLSCTKVNNPPPPQPQQTFYRGADLSFLPQIRTDTSGFNTYYNADSIEQDALEIFKDAGCNIVRLRVWHTPTTSYSSLAEVAAFAQQIKAMGMMVWLTVHYSDWWADPAHQTPPAAWAALDVNTLADSVYNYSYRLAALIKPDIFQVGNEINGGFLWPQGAISNTQQFNTLLQAGCAAVRQASPQTKIMLHYAGISGAATFFSGVDTIDYDQIGLSYYPKWHTQSLIELENTLESLGQTFAKEVLLAEVAYPFTLSWNDWTNNIVGDNSALLPAFEASPQGQADYVNYLKTLIENTTNGAGFCYWAPDWVAYRGPQAQDGSPWENQALFNFNNRALPAMQVYHE